MKPPISLRPALKPGDSDDRFCSTPFPFASSSTLLEQSPHVHFPPTPILTSTALTHSPNVYDRAPIRVSPNNCALPDRGERTYGSDDDQGSPAASSSPPMESYFMPRRLETMHSLQAWAVDGCQSMLLGTPHQRSSPPSPLLVHDMSSESDDSDQCGSPEPLNSPRFPVVSVRLPGDTGSTNYPYGCELPRDQVDSGLGHQDLATDCVALPFARKVKKSLETDINGLPKRRIKRAAGERARKLSTSRCFTSFTPDDAEGCLGGF